MSYSAGSDAPYDGSTVNFPATAKNVIAVGAGYKWNKGDEVELLNAYTVRGTDASGAETFTLNVSANGAGHKCLLTVSPAASNAVSPLAGTMRAPVYQPPQHHTRPSLDVSATPLKQASCYEPAAFVVA